MSQHNGTLNGLSGPFSRRGPAECERCHRLTEATWPWAGWQPLRKIWLGLIAVLVLFSPIYLSDAHGMLPAAMILVFAIGPINGLASIKATCLECGAVVEKPAPSQSSEPSQLSASPRASQPVEV